MAILTAVLPSGSTDGSPVKIVPTATAGTLFHTAHATALDEVYMWLTNTSAADVLVTIEYGDNATPDHNIRTTVPANETLLAIPGVRLTNSKTVRAFAAVANVVNMFGNINRYA